MEILQFSLIGDGQCRKRRLILTSALVEVLFRLPAKETDQLEYTTSVLGLWSLTEQVLVTKKEPRQLVA